MPPSFDVLSYGTIGLDYILRVPYWPTPARGAHAPGEDEHLGGKATNVAVALAGWGVTVAVSGHVIGDDAVGNRLHEILATYPNISTRYLERRAGLRSMYCRILVNPQGERTIIGVNVDENPQTQPTAEMIADARVLTLDLYGGEERVRAARLAAEAGRPVVVGDLHAADHPILPYTTVAIASRAEVRKAYPGWPVEQFASAVQAVGARHVILTDGPREVLLFEAGGGCTGVTPPSVQGVDTTGAGDAFRAGVVFGVLRGWPLEEAAALGAASGSLNVMRPGGANSEPLETVHALARGLERRRLD